ncbi:hypothetical protein HZ996_05640 [Cryomorphaceae bacterium]|nr:hypothetical protein HZ996_05640 [Cryomorphaceae bacterium]
MKAVSKIELIIPSAYAQHRLLAKLDEWGIEGYSVIREVIGKGSSGFKGGDLPVDIGRNWYVLIACDPERVEEIVEAFRPVITKYGGVCLVTDAQMLKKSAFEEDAD